MGVPPPIIIFEAKEKRVRDNEVLEPENVRYREAWHSLRLLLGGHEKNCRNKRPLCVVLLLIGGAMSDDLCPASLKPILRAYIQDLNHCWCMNLYTG